MKKKPKKDSDFEFELEQEVEVLPLGQHDIWMPAVIIAIPTRPDGYYHVRHEGLAPGPLAEGKYLPHEIREPELAE